MLFQQTSGTGTPYTAHHILDARIQGSAERVIGNNGEVNGNNRVDQLINAAMLVAQMGQSKVVTSDVYSREHDMAAANAKIEQGMKLLAAFNDRTGNEWMKGGMTLATKISEAADRLGFMRRILARIPWPAQTKPRLSKRIKTVVVSQSVDGTSTALAQYSRDQEYLLTSFIFDLRLLIDLLVLREAQGDTMTEKMDEGFEAFFVREDKWTLNLLDAMVGYDHPQVQLAGGLTPQNFTFMKQQIDNFQLPVAWALMTHDFYSDWASSAPFLAAQSEVHKYQIIETGTVGTLYGVSLLTDANRVDKFRVLPANTMYMVTAPEHLGGFADGGPIQVNELTEKDLGKASRGWYMWEMLAGGVFNTKGVIRAVRS